MIDLRLGKRCLTMDTSRTERNSDLHLGARERKGGEGVVRAGWEDNRTMLGPGDGCALDCADHVK